MLQLSDEISAFIERKIPLLRIHRYDGIKCTCGKPECQWDAKKGGNAGKHPAEPRGVHSARVVQNASRFEGFNVGVACGRGFVVLDIDPRNGGDKALAELIAANGPLPRTWQVATGGGGTHYYFSVEGEQRSGKRVGGIDLVGLGGYVLAAGSLHPNQRFYEWVVHPDECDMAPLPEWVRDACVSVGVSHEVGEIKEPELYTQEEVLSMLKAINPSCPRETWWRVGAGLKTAGFPMEMWDEWSKGSDKYHADEIKTEWDSYKIGMIKFGTVKHFAEEYGWTPEPVEKWDFTTPETEQRIEFISNEPQKQNKKEIRFPRGLVGEIAKDIYDMAMWKEKRFAIAASESQMAGIAQGRFVSAMDNGSLSLYTMLITRSGGGKADYTKAFDRCIMATDPILDMGEVASPQALRRVLEHCNSRVLGLDEGIKWLASLVDSKDANGQKLYGDFLSAWSGSKLNAITTKDAANNSPAVLNPRVTILGAGPRDAFLRLLQNGGAIAADGLLSRFDFIVGDADMPESFIKKRSFMVTDSIARELKEILLGSKGREFDPEKKQASDTLAFETITRVDWTEQAERAFDDFARFCCMRQNETGLHAVWSRVAEKALRSASNVSIGINWRKPVIELDTFEWAADCKREVAFETEAFCQEHLGKSLEMLCRQKIIEAARRNGGSVTLGKIQAYWKGFGEVPQMTVKQAIERLEAEGVIVPVQKTRRGALQIRLQGLV